MRMTCKCCGRKTLSVIPNHNVWVCVNCDRLPLGPAGESGPENIPPLRRAYPDPGKDHA